SIQKSDDYRADINISFDKNNLILNFSVTDKVIKLFYSPELWSDHIYTMIYNPNFKSDIGGILIGMIFIPVKGADGKLHIRAEYEGSWMDKRNGSEIGDRKSTRLNSSHVSISYAVFCLKKKKNKTRESHTD